MTRSGAVEPDDTSDKLDRISSFAGEVFGVSVGVLQLAIKLVQEVSRGRNPPDPLKRDR